MARITDPAVLIRQQIKEYEEGIANLRIALRALGAKGGAKLGRGGVGGERFPAAIRAARPAGYKGTKAKLDKPAKASPVRLAYAAPPKALPAPSRATGAPMGRRPNPFPTTEPKRGESPVDNIRWVLRDHEWHTFSDFLERDIVGSQVSHAIGRMLERKEIVAKNGPDGRLFKLVSKAQPLRAQMLSQPKNFKATIGDANPHIKRLFGNIKLREGTARADVYLMLERDKWKRVQELVGDDREKRAARSVALYQLINQGIAEKRGPNKLQEYRLTEAGALATVESIPAERATAAQ